MSAKPNPRKSRKLPNIIIPLPNPDKTWHESWYRGRNLLNITHPFRAVLLGPPNTGKTTIAKNLLLRADPPFKQCFIVHCDPEYTKEYSDIECEMLDSIPTPSEWEGQVKTLVILDDLEYKGMGKEQLRNLDRLFGFVSTHKNISVILAAQDAFNVPACVRRCASLWVLWKSPDIDAMATVARRTGLKAKALRQIFEDLLPEAHDSLWIDLTSHSPAVMRKNGFKRITQQSQ